MQLILTSHTCTYMQNSCSFAKFVRLQIRTYYKRKAPPHLFTRYKRSHGSTYIAMTLPLNHCTLQDENAPREHTYLHTNVWRRELLQFNLYGTFLALQGRASAPTNLLTPAT